MKIGGWKPFLSAADAVEKNPEQVLDVDETENVVEGAFVYGNAGALSGGDDGHGLFERSGDGESMNVRTRDHDFANLDFTELHGGLDEFDFAGGNEAAFASLLDEDLKLLDGTDQSVAGRRRNAEKADEAGGSGIEEVDGPTESVEKPIERAGDEESDAFGAGETESLRDELAKDDFQSGEETESDNQSDAVSEHGGPGTRDFSDKRADNVGKSDFTDVAEEKADNSDAYLNAGHDAVEIGEKSFDDPRAGVTLFDKLVNAGGPDGDERKFGGGEKGVDEDEKKDTKEMERDHGAERLGIRVAAAVKGWSKGYRWDALPAATESLKEEERPRGIVRLVHGPPAKCRARKTIWPTW